MADGWSLAPGRSDDYLVGAHGPVPARPADLSFLMGPGSVVFTPGDLLVRGEGGSVAGLEWRRGVDAFFLPRVRDLP